MSGPSYSELKEYVFAFTEDDGYLDLNVKFSKMTTFNLNDLARVAAEVFGKEADEYTRGIYKVYEDFIENTQINLIDLAIAYGREVTDALAREHSSKKRGGMLHGLIDFRQHKAYISKHLTTPTGMQIGEAIFGRTEYFRPFDPANIGKEVDVSPSLAWRFVILASACQAAAFHVIQEETSKKSVTEGLQNLKTWQEETTKLLKKLVQDNEDMKKMLLAMRRA